MSRVSGMRRKAVKAERACKRWTPEEDEYLEQMWGCLKHETLEQKLGRSRCAIDGRRRKLGLPVSYEASDLITRAQVLRAMGLTCGGHRSMALKGAPFTRKSTSNHCVFVMISQADLMEFLRTHQEQYDASLIEVGALGSEPQWLIDKRKADAALRRSGIPRLYSWFTEEEDERLRQLYKSGMPFTEIAKELHRNVGSVRNRIYRLGIARTGCKCYKRPIVRKKKRV